MDKHFTLPILLAGLLMLGLGSCKPEQTFPVVPAITFKSFTRNTDGSADCIIKFTDGDGDIGLNENNTAPPFNPGSKYYSNIYLVYYSKDASGNWVPYDNISSTPVCDTLQFPYRIPYLTQDGQKKVLQGEIKVRLNAPYTPALSGQAFKFKIILIDRALHISNEVETNVLYGQ